MLLKKPDGDTTARRECERVRIALNTSMKSETRRLDAVLLNHLNNTRKLKYSVTNLESVNHMY